MMKLRKKTIFFNAMLITVLLITLFQTGYAREPARVLVLPFTIHSEKDLSFLQKGIEKMLTSRLSSEGNVVVTVGKEADVPQPLTRGSALSAAAKQSADYVVLGSITVFGESISTDAECIDVQKTETVLSFNKLGDSKDDALDHINMFADQVNDEVLSGEAAAEQASQEIVAESVAAPPSVIQVAPVVKPSGEELTTHDFWKSGKIKTQVTGMVIGDVDGDGKNETVLCGEKHIYIYRGIEDKFKKISEVKRETYDRIISVDTADINKNGKSEIFITNIRKKNGRLISYVLEWNGKNFEKIVKDSNWYYRVLNKGGKDILLGQKKMTGTEPFKKGIFELEWNNGQYASAKKLDIPDNMIVYGFVMGDALNNGKEMIINFTRREYLQVLNLDGEEEWTSDESYGGNTAHLVVPSLYDTEETANYYLPQRIHLADLDGDGKNEVVVVKNKDITGRLFSRIRSFASGHIQSLSWNNIGLEENWRTQKISGYISDYTIGDLNNDGQDELVLSVVTKDGKIMGKKKSYVIARYAVK